MVVSYTGLPDLKPVRGIRVSSAAAGIKKPGRKDVTLFELASSSTVAATFTRNKFCAAPVILAKSHISECQPRYLLINTGNANAGTGGIGYENAKKCCGYVADVVGCNINEVLPFSTGVIGEQLPIERMQAVIPELVSCLKEDGWVDAASSILTTDTVPKGSCVNILLSGGEITITGIAKGSGMIRPDMATMLSFVATDAVIPEKVIVPMLREAVGQSFNRITVDGDTSTNDSCVLMASGESCVHVDATEADLVIFKTALNQLLTDLAQQIVKDGEGATKFVTILANSGSTDSECEAVAYAIAHSPLVKTALFASDPNWGRILAAIGRAGIDDLELGTVDIYLDDVCIVKAGEPAHDYTEECGRAVMSGDEISIRVELGRGDASVTVWTCDFSYEYVKINAEYRT